MVTPVLVGWGKMPFYRELLRISAGRGHVLTDTDQEKTTPSLSHSKIAGAENAVSYEIVFAQNP